jgi:hypothetical protein
MNLVEKYNYKDLNRVPVDGIRHYEVGEDRLLPSVTTILSATSDKDFLEKWKKRIGEEEATRIAEQSSAIGEQMHDNLENHILTGAKPQGPMLAKVLTRLIISKGLSKVNEVWGTEVGLYYPGLWAGTCDLVGEFEGIPSIMDFKNSRKDKKDEWVEDYYLQCVAYIESHNKLYGTDIDQGVIMMGCWSGNYLQFDLKGDRYSEYKDKWYERVHTYYSTVPLVKS